MSLAALEVVKMCSQWQRLCRMVTFSLQWRSSRDEAKDSCNKQGHGMTYSAGMDITQITSNITTWTGCVNDKDPCSGSNKHQGFHSYCSVNDGYIRHEYMIAAPLCALVMTQSISINIMADIQQLFFIYSWIYTKMTNRRYETIIIVNISFSTYISWSLNDHILGYGPKQ